VEKSTRRATVLVLEGEDAPLLAQNALLDTDLAATTATRIPVLMEATQALARYNLAAIVDHPDVAALPLATKPPAEALVLAGRRLDATAGANAAAAVLYTSAIATDAAKVDAATYERLGSLKKDAGRWSEAAIYLERANALLGRQPPSKTATMRKRGVASQLGHVYEAAGSNRQAIAAYTAAAQYGDAAAKRRLLELSSVAGPGGDIRLDRPAPGVDKAKGAANNKAGGVGK